MGASSVIGRVGNKKFLCIASLHWGNAKLAKALKASEGLLPIRRNKKQSSTNTKEPEMQLDEVHIAYCHYYATGEGVSIFIALGGSYKHAESIFKKHVPEYFHLGLVIRPISLKEEEVERFLPLPVLDLFATNPSGTTEYFSTVHYNLS